VISLSWRCAEDGGIRLEVNDEGKNMFSLIQVSCFIIFIVTVFIVISFNVLAQTMPTNKTLLEQRLITYLSDQ
jgi:hypothetical protein